MKNSSYLTKIRPLISSQNEPLNLATVSGLSFEFLNVNSAFNPAETNGCLLMVDTVPLRLQPRKPMMRSVTTGRLVRCNSAVCCAPYHTASSHALLLLKVEGTQHVVVVWWGAFLSDCPTERESPLWRRRCCGAYCCCCCRSVPLNLRSVSYSAVFNCFNNSKRWGYLYLFCKFSYLEYRLGVMYFVKL